MLPTALEYRSSNMYLLSFLDFKFKCFENMNFVAKEVNKGIIYQFCFLEIPSIWISWIQTCISSVSFSFFINKRHTSWISSSRGLRQGDRISSYLFILVSHNLTAFLNFAMRRHKISGFNSNLHFNFSHLMYADNLILISITSRKTAQYIKLGFSIYKNLIGQGSNNVNCSLFVILNFLDFL